MKWKPAYVEDSWGLQVVFQCCSVKHNRYKLGGDREISAIIENNWNGLINSSNFAAITLGKFFLPTGKQGRWIVHVMHILHQKGDDISKKIKPRRMKVE